VEAQKQPPKMKNADTDVKVRVISRYDAFEPLPACEVAMI
jgi:hypothetical protein